jgi:hypothetical protein
VRLTKIDGRSWYASTRSCKLARIRRGSSYVAIVPLSFKLSLKLTPQIQTPIRTVVRRGRPQSAHNSIIPRFSAIITACVLSFADSLAKILLICALTVSSEIPSSPATILLAAPAATCRNTSISR